MPNLPALRAAVFTLSGKTSGGGGADIRPPVGARVNCTCTCNTELVKVAYINIYIPIFMKFAKHMRFEVDEPRVNIY